MELFHECKAVGTFLNPENREFSEHIYLSVTSGKLRHFILATGSVASKAQKTRGTGHCKRGSEIKV